MNIKPIRSKENFLIFGSPIIEEEEIEEVVNTLRSGWIGTGPKTSLFEKMFAEYKGVTYSIALHSCTAALHLSLLAADLPLGGEVITTPLTFCATVNAIIHAGLKPVLADVDIVTKNISPKCIEEKITERTVAILPVHFAGRACEMDEIMKIAAKHNLIVIEDCAHAIESVYRGRKCGTFGDFGCFSFYVTKNITTGEGGMVITKNSEYAEKIKRLALHGLSDDAWKRFGDEGYKHYFVVDCGFKYNMMDIQAAIGIHQLKRIEEYRQKRENIKKRYDEAFKDLPVILSSPLTEKDSVDSYHLYQLLINEKETGISRDMFLQQMTYHGIGVGVHYLSLPEHPYYRERFGWKPEDYPNAKKIGRETISIPISPKLSEKDVEDIIKAVRIIILREK